MNGMFRASVLILIVAAGLVPAAPVSFAQASNPEIRGTLGYTGFVDESTIRHVVAGGSARFYLTRRVFVEPQFLYMYHDRTDRDLVAMGNVGWDLRSKGRIVPYLVWGVGLLNNRQLVGTGYYSYNSLFTSGGAGAKLLLTDRIYIAPEFRIGFEPHMQFSGSLGFILSK